MTGSSRAKKMPPVSYRCSQRSARSSFASCFYLRRVIDRYSRPQMRQLWSDERKFQIWLEIEVLACEAMAEIGQIPKTDSAEIRKRARFSIQEIAEI